MKKVIISVLIILITIACLCCAGCDYSFPKANKLKNVTWRDANGYINFHCFNGVTGSGYIILNDTKIDAEFSFGIMCLVNVYVLTEDIPFIEEQYKSDGILSRASFEADDVNKKGRVISTEKNVTLFGIDFGKIELSHTPIDLSEVEIYEYEDWVCNDDILIDNKCYSHTYTSDFLMKMFACTAKTDSGEVEVLLEWVNKESFAIYKGNMYEAKYTEPVARGTYTCVEALQR